MVSSHPVRNIRRLWQTQSTFLRYGFDILIDRRLLTDGFSLPSGGADDELNQLTQAQKIRHMLEELGTTYIKLGQIAGSQYSAIPREISLELQKLQDDIPPFPTQQVHDLILKETGQTTGQAFASFDEEPLAAASIAQVHRATLHDETEVVLKVQRPGIREDIEADLEIMSATAQFLENTVGRNRGLMEIMDEFAISLQRALDFRNEGRNADRLRYNLSGVYGVHVPNIHWSHTTNRILVMDYVEGVKITDVPAVRAAGLDPHDIAARFTQAMSQQILIDGFFHGDPHPGNVIVDLSSGGITFLDMGMMGYLDEELRRELGNAVIALQAPNVADLVRIFLRVGITFKPVDQRALRRALEHIVNRYFSASLSQVSFSDMMYEIMNTLFEHGIRLPAELTLAMKALIQTQEISSRLNPTLQISDIANEVSDQLFWEQFKPGVIEDRLNETTAEVLRLAPIAADAVERLLREARTGKLTLRHDTSELEDHLNQLSANTKRITIGLTIAGISIASAIAMSVNPAEAWSFIPLVGVVGFVLATGLGLWIVIKLLWEIWGPHH